MGELTSLGTNYLAFFGGDARDEECMHVGAGGVAEQRQHTENIAKILLCVWMACSTWQNRVLKDGVLRDGGSHG